MAAPPQTFDTIVIGAGAAGMMCAATAGARGRRTLLLEHNDRVGKKIAISGGGRCNFTNLNASSDRYLSSNPAFSRSALARYTPRDFLSLVEKHRIGWYEKKLGQLFCDTTARAIIDLLIAECREAAVDLRCGVRVKSVEKRDRFHVSTSSDEFLSETVVVASGGLSLPKLGATDLAYRIAERFSLPVLPRRPGLVPLTLDSNDLAVFSALSGLALPIAVRHGGAEFREAMLFTHRGVSGPAILQISSYWHEGEPLAIDLLPDMPAEALDRRKPLVANLAAHWPRRFVDVWCARHRPEKPLAQLSRERATRLAGDLHEWTLRPTGTEGYKTAEVTLGGVDTRSLSSRTMECRGVPGLFFIGEATDVTGWLGGYNFQWAWASGHAAGEVA